MPLDRSVDSADALRAAFLDRLLRALHGATDGLRRRLAADPERATAEQALQRRLGWGWAVANELAGEGGGPDRREPRGAAWLAGCLGAPGVRDVALWPRLAPARCDWRTAYALVLATLCARERAPRVRARVVRAPGAWDWSLDGVDRDPGPALAAELARLFDGALPFARRGPDWRLELPCDWWPSARSCDR